MMSWSILALLGILAAVWLHWRIKNCRLLQAAKNFPGPPSLPILGNFLLFAGQPEREFALDVSILYEDLHQERRKSHSAKCDLRLRSAARCARADSSTLAFITPDEDPRKGSKRRGQTLLSVQTNFTKVIKGLMQEYGGVFKFWLGPDLNIVVSDPDDLKILMNNSKTSVKGPLYKFMADLLGDGILSGSGPTWRRHRKLATPSFGKRAVLNYSGIFNQEADFLLEKLRTITNREIDMYRYIVQTTSYITCQTIMGLTKDQTMSLPYMQDIIDESPKAYEIVFNRMMKWYLRIDPVFWISSYYREQRSFMAKITEFGTTLIQYKKDYLKTLDRTRMIELMNSEEDCLKNIQLNAIDRFIVSEELNNEEIVQEIFTLFTSSQEAGAKIASAILLMLAYHPECQEKLYAEIKSVIGEDCRPITDEDLQQMPYLDMVFKEVVRMFPIGALIQRTVTDDVTISAGVLPAGCSLIVPIFLMQREPRFWDDPDAFDPERFSPANVMKRNPYCYIPFSLGPMDCLGRDYGTKLVKILCARVLQEFHVSTEKTYEDMKIVIAISAKPLDGYHAKLTPRHKNPY